MPDWILLPWLGIITAGWIGLSLTVGRHATVWAAQYEINKRFNEWQGDQLELNKMHANEHAKSTRSS